MGVVRPWLVGPDDGSQTIERIEEKNDDRDQDQEDRSRKGHQDREGSQCEEGHDPVAEKKTKANTEPKKLSAIDAAAKVLAASETPMNCKELIDAMATKGLWTSPGGKTPHATLYTVVTMLPNLAP